MTTNDEAALQLQLNDSQELVILDALRAELRAQDKAIASAEAAEAQQTDPVRKSAESRIIGSLKDRRDTITTLISLIED